MNFTSIEQSKKLVELGIDKYTCDLIHRKRDCGDGYIVIVPRTNDGFLHNQNYFDERSDDIPCWSTGALMNLLPSELIIEDEAYFLFIDVKCKTILYKSYNKYWQEFPSFVSDTLIDNIIFVIKWLKENKYM